MGDLMTAFGGGKEQRLADIAPESTLLYAIKSVELAVRAHMDAILKPAGITALQYTALTVLRHREGLSSAELARNSFVTAQTMGEMIATLERRGLLIRTVDPSHRRRMLAYLTADGRDLLARFDDEIIGLEARMVAGLTPRQRAHFRDYLARCRSALGESGV